MLFNTAQYLIFLPVVILVYYILPRRVKYIWLLAVSYYFYMQWNRLYILLLFLCTVVTYTGGLIIEKQKEKGIGSLRESQPLSSDRKKKICLIVCLFFNLGILGFYKYFEFGINCLNRLLPYFQLNQISTDFSILLPVGISFYTLQSLGYLIDVYRGAVYAEKNFLMYALFVSFFPQLVAGPIERSKNLLVQLHEYHKFSFDNFKKGVLLIVYGLFLKMVIADRAAVIVDTVFGSTQDYPGFYIVAAACFFAVQIYCDFYGYSTIARGSALIMGIHLMDNFAAPYYAKSIKEFWRRWHISLSSWFRDYLYIPLGGNRKGLVRKEANLLFVFAVSGFWHGASLGFIFWGMLHGMYQLAADLVKSMKKALVNIWNRFMPDYLKYNKSIDKIPTFGVRLFQGVSTFLLVSFAWLFFRAGGLSDSCRIIKDMLSVNNWTILLDGSLYGLGVQRNYMYVLLLSILALFIVDYHKYRERDVAALVLRQGWIFQILVVLVMVFVILLYGCYGKMYDTQQFIYFQF